MPLESRQLSRLTELTVFDLPKRVPIGTMNAPFEIGTGYFSVNLVIIPAAS